MSKFILSHQSPETFGGILWPYKYFGLLYFHWAWQSQKLGITFTLICAILHVVQNIVLHHRFVIIRSTTPDFQLTPIIYQFFFLGYICIVPIIMVPWMLKGHRLLPRIISSMENIDQTLVRHGQRLNYRKSLKRQLLHVLSPVVVGTIVVVVVESIRQSSTVNLTSRFFLSTIKNHAVYVQLFIESIFAYLVLCIGERYAIINSLLRKLDEEEHLGLTRLSGRTTTTLDILVVRDLRLLHRQLYLVSQKVNEAFQLQLFLIINFISAYIVCSLYDLYIISESNCSNPSSFDISSRAIWCLVHFVGFSLMGYSCEWSKRQGVATTRVLHAMNVCDEDLRFEVSTFNIQLLHYDVEFSACGFFGIDLEVIRKVIGTTVTYLVILVQMGSIPKGCTFVDVNGDNITMPSNYSETIL